jgi:hypothetical protein
MYEPVDWMHNHNSWAAVPWLFIMQANFFNGLVGLMLGSCIHVCIESLREVRLAASMYSQSLLWFSSTTTQSFCSPIIPSQNSDWWNWQLNNYCSDFSIYSLISCVNAGSGFRILEPWNVTSFTASFVFSSGFDHELQVWNFTIHDKCTPWNWLNHDLCVILLSA